VNVWKEAEGEGGGGNAEGRVQNAECVKRGCRRTRCRAVECEGGAGGRISFAYLSGWGLSQDGGCWAD
jgi:hypothetical protein